MKKFKKALALSLTLAMGLSMVACGDKKSDSTTAAPSGDATTAKTEAKTEAKTDAKSEAQTEAKTDAPAPSAGIAKPDVSGWDDSKKIYYYSWDDDLQKHMDVVLENNPELKPYVEFVNLAVAYE